MAQRRSWTTKIEKALVVGDIKEANLLACALLGGTLRAIKVGYRLKPVEGGYAICNFDATKMLTR